MARILNIISQIIQLSKEAKEQVEGGKYSSARRLFKTILEIEEGELRHIKDESGSDDFYKEVSDFLLAKRSEGAAMAKLIDDGFAMLD